jgi:glycine cleavage system transcriptional repressor
MPSSPRENRDQLSSRLIDAYYPPGTASRKNQVPAEARRKRASEHTLGTWLYERPAACKLKQNPTQKTMQTYLAITLLSKDSLDLVERITRPIAQHKCTLHDSRVVSLGSHSGAAMLIAGSWDRISRLELALRQLATQHDMSLHMTRSEPPTASEAHMSYSVDIVGLNAPDITHVLAQFFAAQGIAIRDLATLPYNSPNNATDMLTLRMQVDIPANVRLALLKEAFFDLCDELNLDATLDPVR